MTGRPSPMNEVVGSAEVHDQPVVADLAVEQWA
jgi:hypothetical protein